jgi:AGZA family xanthine/uracil permease-like MFS transporter
MAILVIRKVKGGIFLAILGTTLVSILFALLGFSTNGAMSSVVEGTFAWSSISNAFSQLGTTFLAAFSSEGMGSLFSNRTALPIIIMTIFSLCLSDTFDTIGTFIGTGTRS